MAPETSYGSATTPTRRAVSAEPSSGQRTRLSIRTPGSSGASRRNLQTLGLSESGRRGPRASAGAAATPHARAAIRELDSRRAAIFTPHRERLRRRSGAREMRDSPRNFLRDLSRQLAPKTQPVPTSSSSPNETGDGRRESSGLEDGDEEYEDDDDDLPIDRPRLSLPIDVEEDDSDLQPHRSAGLEDENFTMQSIELPRRAATEQPTGRLSIESRRMSEYFGVADFQDEEIGIDSGFFPPAQFDETEFRGETEDLTYERVDGDAEPGRRDTVRGSDFDIELGGTGNESTFVIAPQIQSSPTRALEVADPSPDDDPGPDYGDFGFDYGDDRSSTHEGDPDDMLAIQTQVLAEAATAGAARGRTTKRGMKLSKHGIGYPSLPPAVVKRLAQTFAKTSGVKGKISPDTLNAIMQASDWFFEQLGEDLKAYAEHAGRKTINESDMLMMMRRQRQIGSSTTMFSLAQRYLPRELLQELRMPPPPKSTGKQGRRRKARGEDENEDT